MDGIQNNIAKGIVDYFLVPSIKLTEVTALIFFLIIPDWIYNMATQDKLS